MNVRFFVSQDRPPLDLSVPGDCPLPRVGDNVTLREPDSGDHLRWCVKAVSWDYTDPADVGVEIRVGAAVPTRAPSFAAYGD